MSSRPDFREAMKFWFRLGFISFGGPAGQIAILHEFLVEKKKWISEQKFLHALNYCMLLPGPEAQQMATYTGWLLHGVRGGIVAGLFFILPSMFILLALSLLYVSYGSSPYVSAIFDGLKPAVVAIVILALIKISKKSLKLPIHYIIAIGGFTAIYFFRISFPVIILTVILLALILQQIRPALTTESTTKSTTPDEADYYINSTTCVSEREYNTLTLLKRTVFIALLWIIPLLLFYVAAENFGFWKNLITFFSQAALVTFGGAYAVLPYVAATSVEKFQWLSAAEMVDGLALGETTPGPLIMVLAYVGFMAGYHHSAGSLIAGTIGLVTTTWYTFLPSFFFILAGAPLIERTHENEKVKSILQWVTAVVTGVILNLTLYLAEAVYTSNNEQLPFALIWTIISIIALLRFKVNMILWIGISAIWGILLYVGGL